MDSREVTHKGLVWLPDGHVSDWTLSALVDGQDATLPGEAGWHVDSCELCTERMASLAVVAFSLGEELQVWAEEERRQETPFPQVVFGALAAATLGLLLHSWSTAGGRLVDVPHEILTVWRALRLTLPLVAQRLGTGLFVLSSVTAFVAAAGGVVLARQHTLAKNPESPS